MVKSCSDVNRTWQILDGWFGERDRVVDSLIQDLDALKPYDNKGKIDELAMTKFIKVFKNCAS